MPAEISYRLQFSRRVKRLRLQVIPGEVIVTAPTGTAITVIEGFVQSREKWLSNKLAYFASVSLPSVPSEYSEGSVVSVLGEYPVLQSLVSVSGKEEMVLRNGTLTACLPPGNDLSRAVNKWLDCRLLSFSEAVMEKHSGFGVKPSKIRLGNARTRWGSCSSRGVIMINRRLVHAPADVVEYVLIHELVHLRHRNHSEVFWKAVIRVLGDVKPQRKWLRLQGSYLL